MTEYLIPAGPGEASFTEKRSQFLGHVRHAETEDEAREFIAAMKRKYHDARHNCWCYIIKDGPERYSDDGEPQGTAGIPMLEVFRREGICNVVCVVTRYFGGVLLGAGGLLRAYTRSAGDALEAAGRSVVRRWIEAELPCSYSQAERLKGEAEAEAAVVTDVEYGAEVTVKLLVPEEKLGKLRAKIYDASAGTVELKPGDECFRAVPLNK
ncbi:MAG: IMPACT family protein [Candidatus Limivicinus sp.]|jgi:uncharacterized YigZ family protein